MAWYLLFGLGGMVIGAALVVLAMKANRMIKG